MMNSVTKQGIAPDAMAFGFKGYSFSNFCRMYMQVPMISTLLLLKIQVLHCPQFDNFNELINQLIRSLIIGPTKKQGEFL
jgi:hypothetical protein